MLGKTLIQSINSFVLIVTDSWKGSEVGHLWRHWHKDMCRLSRQFVLPTAWCRDVCQLDHWLPEVRWMQFGSENLQRW